MDFEKPTLLLDTDITKRNITRMAEKARQSSVRFRPHFKTHQSAAVGEWFREAGIDAITVSSVGMAQYFAVHGWRDITIAFPVNWRQIDAINQLAAEIRLNLLVESVETVEFLAERLTASVNLWLKIDAGYHRTGIPWSDFAAQIRIAQAAAHSENLHLRGLLTHSGHTYQSSGQNSIREIYRDTVQKLDAVRETLTAQGFPDLEISIGDTPACSVVEDLSDVDEIRPGNFVFYDLMQANIGSCQMQDIAVGVACPVVARHPARDTIIVYGGAIHFSTDFIMQNDHRVYGTVALPAPHGWQAPLPDCYVQSFSQEHGVVKASPKLMQQVQIGDVVVILPVHSCLTVNLHRQYHTADGQTLPIGDF